MVSLEEKQDHFLRFWIWMVFYKSAVLGLIVKQLDFDEPPTFLTEVDQKVLFMKFEALLIYEQLIVVTHDILLRLMNIHRLEIHVWWILLDSRMPSLIIVLVLLVVESRKLLIESSFEVLADRLLFEIFNPVVEVWKWVISECKPTVQDALADIYLEKRGIGGDVLVQVIIILVLLIFQLIKHIILVILRNTRKMVIVVKNDLSIRRASMVFSEHILNNLTSIKPNFSLFLFLIQRIDRERHVVRVDDAHSVCLVKWFGTIIHVNFLVDNFYLMSQMSIVNIGLSFESLYGVISFFCVM